MILVVNRLCLTHRVRRLTGGFGRQEQRSRRAAPVVETHADLEPGLGLPLDAPRDSIDKPGRLVPDALDLVDLIGGQGAELLHILDPCRAQGGDPEAEPVAVDVLHVHAAQDIAQSLF